MLRTLVLFPSVASVVMLLSSMCLLRLLQRIVVVLFLGLWIVIIIRCFTARRHC